MAPFLGPALGPLIGAYIIDQYNNKWRFTQWVILFIAAPIFLISLVMQETMKSRILYLRTKKVTGKAPRQEGDTHLLLRKLGAGLFRPFHMMLLEVRTLLPHMLLHEPKFQARTDSLPSLSYPSSASTPASPSP